MALILPNTLTNGTTADASQVQANFAAVKTAVDAIAAPALVQIQSVTLGSTSSFNFTGIPATYNNLLIVGSIRGADAGSGTHGLRLTFNSNTAASYQYSVYIITTATIANGSGVTSGYIGNIPSAQAGAGSFGAVRIDIPGYRASGRNRTALAQVSGSATNFESYVGGCELVNTTAVTSVQINADAGNLASGSVLTLYGTL